MNWISDMDGSNSDQQNDPCHAERGDDHKTRRTAAKKIDRKKSTAKNQTQDDAKERLDPWR